MVVKQKEPPVRSIRFSVDDRLLIAALKKHLGVASVTDIVRQGLRALAQKEGVSA